MIIIHELGNLFLANQQFHRKPGILPGEWGLKPIVIGILWRCNGRHSQQFEPFSGFFSNWMGSLVQQTLCGICTDQLSETAGVEFPDHVLVKALNDEFLGPFRRHQIALWFLDRGYGFFQARSWSSHCFPSKDGMRNKTAVELVQDRSKPNQAIRFFPAIEYNIWQTFFGASR